MTDYTPWRIAAKLIQMADLNRDSRILDPCSGAGMILEYARKKAHKDNLVGVLPLYYCEKDVPLSNKSLEKYGFEDGEAEMLAVDFFEVSPKQIHDSKINTIIMDPGDMGLGSIGWKAAMIGPSGVEAPQQWLLYPASGWSGFLLRAIELIPVGGRVVTTVLEQDINNLCFRTGLLPQHLADPREEWELNGAIVEKSSLFFKIRSTSIYPYHDQPALAVSIEKLRKEPKS